MTASTDDPTFLDRCSDSYRRAVSAQAVARASVGGYVIGHARQGSRNNVIVRLITTDVKPVDVSLSPQLALGLAAELQAAARKITAGATPYAAGDGQPAPG